MTNNTTLSTLLAGFKFGFTLQFAIGPVGLFLFQTAAAVGFLKVFPSIFGVMIVDGICILLAVVGVGALMQKSYTFRTFMKYFGTLVLLAFAGFVIMTAFSDKASSAFNVSNISALKLAILVFFMTLSSPVTILFWTGLFSLKITENPDIKYNLTYGAGALLSVLAFLSCLTAFASFAGALLSPFMLSCLNVAVGCYLIHIAIKTLRRKDSL